MVDGKPGTGDTPLEKFLALVMACWYLASIFPVILAHMYDSVSAKQAAILGPLFYHFAISINAFLYMGIWNLLNPESLSNNAVVMLHAFLGVICVALYRSYR